MDVKELRIGNIILADYGGDIGLREIRVFQINESGCVFDEESNEFWDETLKGVPITEELLILLGLESFVREDKRYWRTGHYMFISGHWRFRFSQKSKELILYIHDDYIRHIKFIHELQNVYFSLTNEEIEINE